MERSEVEFLERVMHGVLQLYVKGRLTLRERQSQTRFDAARIAERVRVCRNNRAMVCVEQV